MAPQTRVTERDTYVNAVGTALVSGNLVIRSGAMPATTATARTGTIGVTIPLGATPFTTASGTGSLVLAASKQANASASITAGYASWETSGAAVVLQCLVGPTTTTNTSALTAANGDILTFSANPANAIVGAKVSGTGIAAGTFVLAVPSGTTLLLSRPSTAGVASGAAITIDFDATIDNAVMANGQSVTVSAFTYTPGDA